MVMRRPSSHKVMTVDEKVQYILQNGHILREKFIVKPPTNARPPREPRQRAIFRRKSDIERPLMTKTGRLKKKTKPNLQLIDDILKNELMIQDTGSPKKPSEPLPVVIDNNNDFDITDQNNIIDFSDSEDDPDYDVTFDEESSSGSSSDSEQWSDECPEKPPKRIEKDANGKPIKKFKRKPRHITLKNGVVLRLAYFECDYCKRTFNKKCSLRRHMFMHLDIKPFPCPRCPEAFRSRYNMQVHVERYHRSDNDSDLHVCSYCEATFLVKANLETHLQSHMTVENTYKCIYCGKVYQHHTRLMHHEKIHMVDGYYQCSLCSMSYRCRNRLYDHVKSHLKIKDFVCQYCGKEFLRQNSMMRHVEVSHGGVRIVCPICKKNLKGHLTEHMRTHQKKRPHKCPDCGQCFVQSTQMNVHRRAHTGARPYPCRICKRRFSHSNALMLHIRRHTGEKPFPCALCPMTFSQLPHMKCHMRKIHGKLNPYKCSKCDLFFKLKSELDSHEATCTNGTSPDAETGKKKKSKKSDDIEVDSPMPLHRMRYLLALLLTMIATEEKLKFLGFNKRLIDELLIESLEAMGQTPCKDGSLSPVVRLRNNIEVLLLGTVPKDQMEKFKKENKSTEDILELLTSEKDK
ncbi:zinc finger protein 79-like isoform X2 [Trichoplusia ni]|nr:zinc finger protein 79-like isoform X2 [Trichoplusia ni]XP_026732762.1 zinc finger protein 79-like isoform X2 [Trichoplusia ni]XP_026732769.1 zinc finger protein 79-like isoform X2 [Trichoplusia ni]